MGLKEQRVTGTESVNNLISKSSHRFDPGSGSHFPELGSPSVETLRNHALDPTRSQHLTFGGFAQALRDEKKQAQHACTDDSPY